jgi:hypothetical protein
MNVRGAEKLATFGAFHDFEPGPAGGEFDP